MSSGSNATFPQVAGQPFDLYFVIFDDQGQPILEPAGLASRVVIDGRVVVGPVPTIADKTTGVCVARLTRTHTSGRAIVFVASSTSPDALTYYERFHTSTVDMAKLGSRVQRQRA